MWCRFCNEVSPRISSCILECGHWEFHVRFYMRPLANIDIVCLLWRQFKTCVHGGSVFPVSLMLNCRISNWKCTIIVSKQDIFSHHSRKTHIISNSISSIHVQIKLRILTSFLTVINFDTEKKILFISINFQPFFFGCGVGLDPCGS